jgi:hypothetical protein
MENMAAVVYSGSDSTRVLFRSFEGSRVQVAIAKRRRTVKIGWEIGYERRRRSAAIAFVLSFVGKLDALAQVP